MKFLVRAIAALVLTLIAGLPARAQFAVFDPANFTQNLQQVAHMLTQLKRIQTQIEVARNQFETAKAQLQGASGHRGMGRLVVDATRDYLPPDWKDAVGAGSSVYSLARDIKAEAKYLSDANLAGVNSAYRDALRASGDSAINGMASAAAVFESSSSRFQRLQVLMDKIETAEDQKAIDDLQARIQAEQTMLQNELIRAQAMNAMIVQQQRIEAERQRQMSAAESFDY